MVTVAETERIRVGDAERERVATRLAAAHAEGRLTLAEYDERVRAAHGAVVAADLAPLTADLPTDLPRDLPADVPTDMPAERPARAAARRPSPLRLGVAVWAAVSVLNFVIWMAVSVGTGAVVAPWWIWVAGPWGAVLALHALAARVGVSSRATLPFGCASLRR